MAFREKRTGFYDHGLETPQMPSIDRREKALILDLMAPRRGEHLLGVGFDAGAWSLLFRDLGCDVTGVVPSTRILEMAKQKLGQKAELYLGTAEDLPFSDSEFDIVSLILSLEFTEDPEKAISEAIRVCRGRVFLGVMNKYSITARKTEIKELIGDELYKEARFYNAGELLGMVRRQLPGADILWGSVIFLSCLGGRFAAAIDKAIPVRKNPFGAFLGLSFNVNFNLRTVQDIIRTPFQIKAKGGQPVQEVVREGQIHGFVKTPHAP